MVLYALHRLNFPLKVEIVTNIIHFTDDLCIFTSVFNLSLLNTHLTNRKKQSLLFYLKNIVLYELLNNPTPNFKFSILESIIEEKYMKYLTLVDILLFWHCLANAIKNHTFASLTSGSEHLLKYVTYVTWHNE